MTVSTSPTMGQGTGFFAKSTSADHAIVVDDAQLLFGGDYKRAGLDLIVSRDGHALTLHDYFKEGRHADLMSRDGARLTGDVVDTLTGYEHLAQASAPAPATGKVICTVTKLTGTATAMRNGVAVTLHEGDSLNQGDVIQAGTGGELTMTFIDGTVFAMSSNARMVLNDMIYDPNGSSNSSLLTLVQGTISFVAGETAKHGDMKVDTPVATMGIRGTALLVEIGFEVTQAVAPPVKFEVLAEPGNVVGSALLFNKLDPTVPIATVNQTGIATFVNGSGTVTQTAAPMLSDLAKQIATDALSTYFPGYVPDLNGGSRNHGSPPYEQPTSPLGTTPIVPPDQTPPLIKINATTGSSSEADQSDVLLPPQPPMITGASFTVFSGRSVLLSSANLSAADSAHDANFTFTVSNVSHGTFQVTTDSTHWIDTTAFTTAELNAGDVRFVADNSGLAPTFSVQADNGQLSNHLSTVVGGNVQLIVHVAPAIVAASLAVNEGSSVVLSAANFSVTDADSSNFTFTVSNVTHGAFQITSDGVHWTDTTTFTTADLDAGHVRFQADGSDFAPTFSVQVDDGGPVNNLSNVLDGKVAFTNDAAPVIKEASFAVDEHGFVVLSPLNFRIDDPDSANFTFTVSNVTHGSFQVTSDGVHWTDTTTFTTADLNAGHVRFQADDSDYAPTFSVQVDNGEAINNLSNLLDGKVAFTNDAAPVIKEASFEVGEGAAVVLSASDFSITDPDSATFAFTVSNVTHGSFQVTSDGVHWTDTTTFTTADLDAGHVRFQADGSDYAPTFSVQVDNGEAVNNLSNVLDGKVAFENDAAPVITAVSFAVHEHGFVVLSPSNFSITDPDSSNFTFTVSNVTHGSFQVSSDGVHWTDTTTFTTADLNAGHVRFLDDGSDYAPTFSVQVDNGEPVNHASNVFDARVTFIDDDDEEDFSRSDATTAAGTSPVNPSADVASAVPVGTDAPATNTSQPQPLNDISSSASIVPDDNEPVDSRSVFARSGTSFLEQVAPLVIAASLALSEHAAAAVLSPSDFGIADANDASVTIEVSDVRHGHFQITIDGVHWTETTMFTTADLKAGHVRFVDDGSNATPTYTVQVTDAELVHRHGSETLIVVDHHANASAVGMGDALAFAASEPGHAGRGLASSGFGLPDERHAGGLIANDDSAMLAGTAMLSARQLPHQDDSSGHDNHLSHGIGDTFSFADDEDRPASSTTGSHDSVTSNSSELETSDSAAGSSPYRLVDADKPKDLSFITWDGDGRGFNFVPSDDKGSMIGTDGNHAGMTSGGVNSSPSSGSGSVVPVTGGVPDQLLTQSGHDAFVFATGPSALPAGHNAVLDYGAALHQSASWPAVFDTPTSRANDPAGHGGWEQGSGEPAEHQSRTESGETHDPAEMDAHARGLHSSFSHFLLHA